MDSAIEKLDREIYHKLQIHRYDPHYEHPVNDIVSSLIKSNQNEELFLLVIACNNRPVHLSHILHAMRFACLEAITDKHYFLLKHLLMREDLRIRSAAVELLEHWGTESAIKLLQDHHSREKTKWLQDYIYKVLNPKKE